MKNIIKKYKELTLSNKIIVAAASLFTIATIVMIPVAAWFSSQRKLAELQSIKTPDLLYISAACAEDVKYFDISSVDVGEPTSTAPAQQLYPFAVAGQYVSRFTLQFAHTTNNQFTYKIYEGDLLTYTETVNGEVTELPCTTETQAKNAYIALNAPASSSWTEEQLEEHFRDDVASHEVNEQWEKIDMTLTQREEIENAEKVYFVKGTCINDGDDYLNSQEVDGRLIATDKYHEECYGTYNKFDPYAEPLYWQKSSIQSVEDPTTWGAKPFFKTYILEISWDRSKISNNKETDMLYIAAFREN